MMELKVSKQDLSRVMKIAGKVVDRGSKTPMAASVLLRADGSVITLNAVGLDAAFTSTVTGKVTGKGDVALNATELLRIAGDAPGDELAMKVDDTGWCEIRAGKARYKVAYIAGREYPAVPKPSAKASWTSVVTAPFLSALSRGGYAYSTDESRAALCGVLIDTTDKDCLLVSSADGHRMARQTMEANLPKVCRCIPVRWTELVPLVSAHAESVEVCLEDRAFVRANGAMVSSSWMLGEFPSRAMLDPVFFLDRPNTIAVKRDEFTSAVKRVAPLTTELCGLVIDACDKRVIVSSRDANGREISDEIDADIKGRIRIGIVSDYVLECLAVMTGEVVEMHFAGPLEPIMVKDGDDARFTGVLMPIRINE